MLIHEEGLQWTVQPHTYLTFILEANQGRISPFIYITQSVIML